MATEHSPPYVFVSYASADRERVLPLVTTLEQAGIPLWIDREGIGGGESYAAEINDAIERCAALLLMCTERSLASRNVRQELALAWEHERPYVPILLEQVTIPGEVKYWLTAAQWIEAHDRPASRWLPAVLDALEPLGIAPRAELPEGVTLAGRDSELAHMRDLLAETLRGHGSLTLIGGEAGIGKTALADALCREADQQGALILTGRCFDLAETPPYGPWIDLFARYPSTHSLPALPPAFAERGTVGAVSSQMALFVQVQDVLTELTARRPVVLLLDDLHWADPASLDLVRFLMPALPGNRLLILATYRSDEIGPRNALYQALPSLARGGSVGRVDLHRLPDDAVRSLLSARYVLSDEDAERLVGYLQSRAEGNPLFLGELLRSLEEAGSLAPDGDQWRLGDLTTTAVPALLRQVIDGRVSRLDEESRRLLGVAAVIGHEAPLALWATVGDVTEDELLACVEQGLATHLLVEAPSSAAVRFSHALIREALYEGIPGIRRRRLHLIVAEALAAGTNPDPDDIAYHFLQDGDERAVAWLKRAGDRAAGAFAWLTAADRFQRAADVLEERGVEENERGWLLFRVAKACGYAYPERAVTHLEAAGWIARAVDDRALAARVMMERGHLGCIIGDVTRGIHDFRTGGAMLDALSESERARLDGHDIPGATTVDQYGRLALWLAITGRFAEARSAVDRILAPRSGEGHAFPPTDIDRAQAAYGLGFINAALGRSDDARHAFADSRAGFLAEGDSYIASMTASQELVCLLRYNTDDKVGRKLLADEAGAVWRPVAGALDEFAPLLVHAPLLLIEGIWDEAHAMTRTVHEHSTAHWTYVTVAKGVLGVLSLHRGDTELAWELVREMLPEGPDSMPGSTRYADALLFQELAAALALESGDLPAARVWLDAHDRWVAWAESIIGQAEGHLGWAAYYRAAGDTGRALEHAEHALAAASNPRQPLVLLAAHRLLGELDTESGTFEEAEKHLQQALDLADACAAPFERALSLLALAELRVANHDVDRARDVLDEARATFRALGATPALERSDALATRLAGAARPRHPVYPAGLSAREVDVLRLVAAGATNAEIAEQLFVAVRTVETHMRSIYNKLGHTSRTAATRFAIEHDLI